MKKPLRILVILIVFLGTLGAAVYATTGYKAPSGVIPFETQRLGAVTGDAGAALRVARFYFTGAHVDQNDARGAKWIECAARKGDARAIVLMGFLYMGGIGVDQDFAKAREWLTKSDDPRAIEIALGLQHFDKAVSILPETERTEKIEANYEAARQDMRANVLKMLEEEE